MFVLFKGMNAFSGALDWLQRRNNAVGFLAFTAAYCVNVSLFLPGVVFVLGAGFVFKFWRGLAAVWIGGTIGQALAFLLGRYLLRDCIVTLGRGKWRKWEVVDKAIELDGWKLVLLLRLSPLVPYNLLNVTMAMTKIDFWQFAMVSSVAIVPESAVMCYFGSLAKNVRDVVGGHAGPSGIINWVLGGLSVALCLLAAGWSTVVARRAMKRAEAIIRLAHHMDEERGQNQHQHLGAAILEAKPYGISSDPETSMAVAGSMQYRGKAGVPSPGGSMGSAAASPYKAAVAILGPAAGAKAKE